MAPRRRVWPRHFKGGRVLVGHRTDIGGALGGEHSAMGLGGGSNAQVRS